MKIKGWNIISLTAILLLLLCISIFTTSGISEDSIRNLIRSSAKSSLFLFLLAFSASSLYLLYKNNFSKWMIQNRRYLGLSFALSHFVHLGAIFALGILYPHPFLDELSLTTYIGGSIAYAYILAMSITSFMPVRKKMKPAHWKFLHVTGSYFFWIVFAQSYIPKAPHDFIYIPFALLLLIVLLLRIQRFRTTRKK